MSMKESIEQDAQTAAILDAAATVFAEHGFAGARVDAIAKAAGLNKAMLYYRIGDKARLYELVVMRQFARVASVVEAGASSAGDPSARLRSVLQGMAALFSGDPRLPRIMAWELASGGGTLPDAVVNEWGRILGTVAPLAAPAGLDPVLAYFSLAGPMMLTCLTEPIRKRLAAGMPGLPSLFGRVAEVGVGDMAAYLANLYARATERTPGTSGTSGGKS